MATLENLESNQPNWTGKSETAYLKGEIEWSRKHYSKAWLLWADLNPGTYSKRIAYITGRSNAKMPVDSLSSLNQTSQISEKPIFLNWMKDFQTKPTDVQRTTPKIGVVLPFQLKEIGKKQKSCNPSLDFYKGMSFANEVCTALDSGLDIHCFDSEGTEAGMKKLLDNNSFSGLDAVVGPLKMSLLPPLSAFTQKEGIPVFNPLSNQEIVDKEGSVFGLQPGFNTIAKACFTFISKQAQGCKYGIVYGPEKNDSLLAVAYRDYANKMGKDLILFKKVGKNSAANLPKFLMEAGMDSTGHIFVPNNESLVRVQFLSAYDWIKAKYPVMVYGKWIESSNSDFEEYVRNPVYFANPDFPDQTNPQWKIWESSYIAKWGTPPNWIAWKGFDLGMFLSKTGYSQGFQGLSQKNWSEKSEIFGQYRFSRLQADNQYVPIYKMEKEGIKRVWPEGF